MLREAGRARDGDGIGNVGSWADECRRADFLVNMSASADVLAQAKVEIDLAAIPEGKNVRLPNPFLTRSELSTTTLPRRAPRYQSISYQAASNT